MFRQITIILFLFLGFSVFAQSYNYIQYTPNDGLPSSEVYHVLQDSKGYIWFATDNGVSRFDGYEFKNFTIEDGLPDNTVFEIYEDLEGKLWFISFSAKLSYFRNDSLVEYEYNNELIKSIKKPIVPIKKGFYIDSLQNVYWCDFYNDITRISKNGTIEKIAGKSQLIILDEHVFINDHGNIPVDSVYITHKEDVYYSGISLKDQIHWKYFKVASKINDKIYFASQKKLFCIKNYTVEQEKRLNGDIIWLNYQNEILWVGTSNGLYGYENGIICNNPKYKLFENKNVSSILIDKENSMWITTLNNGVYYIPDLRIMTISNETKMEFASLAKGFNGILFGLNNGTIGEYFNGKISFIPGLEYNNSTLINTRLHPLDSNEIAVTTQTKGFILKPIHQTKSSEKLYNVIELQDNGGRYNLNTMLKDSTNTIWSGSIWWIFKSTNNYIFSLISIENIPTSAFYSIVEISANKLLIGRKDGIWEFNTQNNSFESWGARNKAFSHRTNALKVNQSDKSIWIGTKSNGIFIKKKDTIININTENGISSNFITCIENHKDEMWVGTKGGGAYHITKDLKSPNKYNIQTYLSSHGISSNEVNDIVVNDTFAYIASNLGLNIIKYNKFEANYTPPPIYIDRLSINNIDRAIKQSYNLSYNENSFNVVLTGLAYKLSGNVKYKYRLTSSPKDSNWVYTSNRNIQLSYIPPGNYTFQAKAINENNIESNQPVEIKIRIKPPFWKTWWFIVLIIAVGIIITSLFVLYVNNERNKVRIEEINERNTLEKEFIENKNLLQQEIEKFRQQALSQQMNPHFIFNSLNSIQYFIYQNEKALSNKYLTKFSRLIRIILENSQHQTIPLKDEFEALQLYLELEEMRLQGKLKFTIEIDKSINLEFYTIPPLLIQPFAENAIWHGIVNKKDKGKVIIKLIENTDHFTCIIEDDGVGREKAKEIQARKQKLHKSLGASITERRLSLLNSTYGEKNTISYTDLMNDGAATGTRVELKIPKQSSIEIKTS